MIAENPLAVKPPLTHSLSVRSAVVHSPRVSKSFRIFLEANIRPGYAECEYVVLSQAFRLKAKRKVIPARR